MNTEKITFIHETVAWLDAIDIDNSDDLRRASEQLESILASLQDDATCPDTTSRCLRIAKQNIDELLGGRVNDPLVSFEEARVLLAVAIEELPSVESPPQPEPSESLNSSTDVEPAPSPSTAEADDESETPLELLSIETDMEMLGDFVTESFDLIEGAEAGLLMLETDAEDMESVNTVFRAFHTVKGTAAFLGVTVVAELAHRAEWLLSRARDQEIRCTGGYADLALRSIDMLKALMEGLRNLVAGVESDIPDGYRELMQLLADPEGAGFSEQATHHKATETDTSPPVEEAAEAVVKAPKPQRRSGEGEQVVEQSVRIRTDRLDSLIDMVGELVIAHSMVAQDEVILDGGHHGLIKKVNRVSKLLREMQDLSMSMRMVPFRATFQKMARVIRDTARKCGKEIDLILEGEDTEIDRNMVDVISDPLVHMVRNAADHGIEMPGEREQAGKPLGGVVRLSAYHQGGDVVVKLEDDGKGMRRENIVAKAISKELIESDQGMTDSEVFSLIFEPGFSTAEQVTDVSGRGVGMDVVRRSIESLKGRIEIASEEGKGTSFTIYLPLTLAITDGMLVRVGNERYIIPTVDIYMSFQPVEEALSTVVGRGELVTLRGDLIPLVRLHHLFELCDTIENPTQGLLVVVNGGEQLCALLVDELLGQQQVVVKSLGEALGAVPGISGAAILGDGKVGLILDPIGISSLARQSVAPSWDKPKRLAVVGG